MMARVASLRLRETGARRSIRDTRAAVLISMPWGQGMQYPQPRQNSP